MHTQSAFRIWLKRLVVGALLLIWILGLVWAFWWYEGQYLKTFERPAYFGAEAVAPPFEPGQVQVLHVWQAGCPCNGGHQAYVEEMTQRFADKGVQFARSGQSSARSLPGVLKKLPFWPIPKAWTDWPGAPAVAIWDAAGKLAYVGPYSDGTHCSQDSSFIEPVINALLAGRRVNILNQDTVSCLCDIQ
ncbi:DUF6436 domain-containing protein [Pseudomonas sp. NyZ704]|nr:DUF6436 domain-containing protein [Pseudomonas sp. NyZ704]